MVNQTYISHHQVLHFKQKDPYIQFQISSDRF